jgi:hypothetical protein
MPEAAAGTRATLPLKYVSIVLSGGSGFDRADEPEPMGMDLLDEAIEVIEFAEHRIDPAVIRDVIAEIGHGDGTIGEIQSTSTPSQVRWASPCAMPVGSPIPSPFGA